MLIKDKRKAWRTIFLIAVAIASYPTFVLTYTWSHVLKSELPGGRHGPLDAYRHTLASAVVAHTAGKNAVLLVNRFMEKSGKASNAMDIHNNLVGASIGRSTHSFSAIEPAFATAVATGSVNAVSADQVTWLEPNKWQGGKLR